MYIACTYCSRYVHSFINLYIYVCTLYRALRTDLHILVHMVRIPDGPSMMAPGGTFDSGVCLSLYFCLLACLIRVIRAL